MNTESLNNDRLIGIAADHGGFELKEKLMLALKNEGYEVVDFGASQYDKEYDYPDMIAPLVRAIMRNEVEKGLAICGSGVRACITANKVPGVRAALITDPYSARQGVEDNSMNVMCLGGSVIGYSLAFELVRIFLNASFKGIERYVLRLNKVSMLESEKPV